MVIHCIPHIPHEDKRLHFSLPTILNPRNCKFAEASTLPLTRTVSAGLETSGSTFSSSVETHGVSRTSQAVSSSSATAPSASTQEAPATSTEKVADTETPLTVSTTQLTQTEGSIGTTTTAIPATTVGLTSQQAVTSTASVTVAETVSQSTLEKATATTSKPTEEGSTQTGTVVLSQIYQLAYLRCMICHYLLSFNKTLVILK